MLNNSPIHSEGDAFFRSILDKAYRELALDLEEIVYLLGINDNDKLHDLYEAACDLRERYFGSAVYLYGFLYLSTYCRNNCAFCYFRRENAQCVRYRKSTEEIVEAGLALKRSGVHLLDVTMGEDPYFHGHSDGHQALLHLLERVSSATALPLMISPGVVSEELLKKIRATGVSWYACYQETYNKQLFQALRREQCFSKRLAAKRSAQRLGFQTEEGILCGVGEGRMDLARSVLAMSSKRFDQVRAMSFVPQAGTPMEDHCSGQSDMEHKLIAILRMLNPAKLIPASLDVDGLKGLRDRLQAGANVITSIVPPGYGLSGVANHALDIENFNRTVGRIKEEIESSGLHIGSLDRYRNWIEAAPMATVPETSS